jgi:hypothetical protein
MILDGQQRMTSLHVAARGLTIKEEGKLQKDYKKICFDLVEKTFLVTKRGEDRKQTVSVRRFFDNNAYQEVYNTLPEDRRNTLSDCRDRIASYPLSVVEVQDMNLEDAIVIFERINQGGKKLGLFDLIVASTWTPSFDLKEKVVDLNDRLEKSGFGKITDEEVFTQLLALLIKGLCTRSVQLQLSGQDVAARWDAVAKSLALAVDFVAHNLGATIYDFVPYPSMLAMVAYIFAKAPGHALSKPLTTSLSDWYWRTAFSQRYGASTPTLMSSDITDYFDRWLAGDPVSPDFPTTLRLKDLEELKISTRSAVKNAIFSILALKGPRHFKNNTAVILNQSICSDYNSKQNHHIFPRAYLQEEGVKHRHLLMNFAFIPAELNNEIKARPPHEYLNDFRKENENLLETLTSHFIDGKDNSAIWTNDYNGFIKSRASLIASEIERLTGKELIS